MNNTFFFLLKNISCEILNNDGKARRPNLFKFLTDLICDDCFETFLSVSMSLSILYIYIFFFLFLE